MAEQAYLPGCLSQRDDFAGGYLLAVHPPANQSFEAEQRSGLGVDDRLVHHAEFRLPNGVGHAGSKMCLLPVLRSDQVGVGHTFAQPVLLRLEHRQIGLGQQFLGRAGTVSEAGDTHAERRLECGILATHRFSLYLVQDSVAHRRRCTRRWNLVEHDDELVPTDTTHEGVGTDRRP